MSNLKDELYTLCSLPPRQEQSPPGKGERSRAFPQAADEALRSALFNFLFETLRNYSKSCKNNSENSHLPRIRQTSLKHFATFVHIKSNPRPLISLFAEKLCTCKPEGPSVHRGPAPEPLGLDRPKQAGGDGSEPRLCKHFRWAADSASPLGTAGPSTVWLWYPTEFQPANPTCFQVRLSFLQTPRAFPR